MVRMGSNPGEGGVKVWWGELRELHRSPSHDSREGVGNVGTTHEVQGDCTLA